jgi:hypothetical protein
MYLSVEEIYVIVLLGAVALGVLVAIPVGMGLASLIQWLIDRWS